MSRQKSLDPIDRMGAYKRLSDVPHEDLLATYTRQYDGVDVWSDFVAAQTNDFDSPHYQQTFTKTEQSWKTHIADRGRHHALAIPQDVEQWCEALSATRTTRTVYTQYWVRLEEFYTWLQWHADYPHVYHPVLMAAARFDTAGGIWAEKVGGWEARRNE